jgi:heptaprenyl diphosphate synthase
LLSSASETRSAPAAAPWLVCPSVIAGLPRVEARLRDTIRCDDRFTEQLCLHMIEAGGKRLRPILALLAACFGDGPPSSAVDVAAAVELMHLATLYHDDIMDEAVQRRGRPSVNRTWGNLAATFAGTYLFARAADIAAAAGKDASRAMSEAAVRVWRGQTLEMHNAFRLDLDESAYFEVIAHKTAALIELPCRLGATIACAPTRYVEALVGYGRALGLAFQLVDDVMDIVADESYLGKVPGADLRSGIYTLPVIVSLRAGGADGLRLRRLLRSQAPTQQELEEAVAIVRRGPGVSRTLEQAGAFAAQARAALGPLPPGDARDSLHELSGFIVERVWGLGGS